MECSYSVVLSFSSPRPPVPHLPHLPIPHLPHPPVPRLPHLHPNPKECPSSDSTHFCLMWTSTLGSRRMLVLMLLSYQWRTGDFPGKDLPPHNLSLTDVSEGSLYKTTSPPHHVTDTYNVSSVGIPFCRRVFVYCTLLITEVQ